MTSTPAQHAQPSAPTQTATAQPAEPCFLLSGTAADALRQLGERYPRLLTAETLGGLPARLPATKLYDFRRERPLSEVLERLCSDLKLPAIVQVDQQWRKLRALPHAAVLSAEQWGEVLAGRAQLASPARFARHGHALEGWSSPWIADERAPYWGPAKCYLCAVDGISPNGGRMFYYPHDGDCEPQCSGLDGRCGSPLCNGCCVGCVRGNADCWGSCGAGGPCEAFADGEPLSGGPCVEGEGDAERQVEQDERALIKPPAPQPTKPAPKPIAPSLPKVLTDEQPAKRLAVPATVKPQRKPLDVGAALANLRK